MLNIEANQWKIQNIFRDTLTERHGIHTVTVTWRVHVFKLEQPRLLHSRS